MNDSINNETESSWNKRKRERCADRANMLLVKVKKALLTKKYELSGNTLDLTILIGNLCVGHASCYYKQDMNIVTISSLYVVKQFRNIGLEDRLFKEIELFAVTRCAKRIDGILGPEHDCIGGWIGIDRQKELYKEHGYRYGGELCGHFSYMERWL